MIAKHTAFEGPSQPLRDIAARAIWLLFSLGIACTPAIAFQIQRESVPSPEKKQPASSQTRANVQVEILSDTLGVNFGPYLHRMFEVVKKHWYREIPNSARAPQLKVGKVVVKFAILKNGDLTTMTIDSSSGDTDLDRAALAGVRLSKPFDPLPAEFHGAYLSVRINFFYNTALQEQSGAAKTSLPAPPPNPPPSFRVPIGIDLTKSLPVSSETDSDFSSSVTGVEVLSPKDFRSYDLQMFLQQRLLPKIRQHWYDVIPEKAKKKKGVKGSAKVTFSIKKDGTFTSVELSESSGDPELDRAALDGVKSTGPVPLPANFAGDHLTMRVTFYYNPPKNTREKLPI